MNPVRASVKRVVNESPNGMNRKKGFALVFAVGIMSIIMAIMVSFFAITTNDLSLANTTANTIRAYYLAEAGLARKFVDLRGGNGSDLPLTTLNLAPGNSGSFSVTCDDSSPRGAVLSEYTLVSTGTYKNISKILTLIVRQASCVSYMHLTGSEKWPDPLTGTPIWFLRGDVVRGPLHTNSQLNISLDPVFEGAVSSGTDPISGDSSINYYHGGPPEDAPDFRESLALAAPDIKISDYISDITAGVKKLVPGNKRFSGDTSIVLLSNGTMNVITKPKDEWVSYNVPLPQSKVLFVTGGYVYISGILSGQLAVGTDTGIYVVGDIFYKDLYDYSTYPPLINPNCTDMLILASDNNIYVGAPPTPPFPGVPPYVLPDNLEIDTYLLANKSFTLWDLSSPDLKGTLKLYGGVTQMERGPLGSFDNNTGERISGYMKDYYYDIRLANFLPDYFKALKDSNRRTVYFKKWPGGWIEGRVIIK